VVQSVPETIFTLVPADGLWAEAKRTEKYNMAAISGRRALEQFIQQNLLV
jgi:hypothetical protein